MSRILSREVARLHASANRLDTFSRHSASLYPCPHLSVGGCSAASGFSAGFGATDGCATSAAVIETLEVAAAAGAVSRSLTVSTDSATVIQFFRRTAHHELTRRDEAELHADGVFVLDRHADVLRPRFLMLLRLRGIKRRNRWRRASRAAPTSHPNFPTPLSIELPAHRLSASAARHQPTARCGTQ